MLLNQASKLISIHLVNCVDNRENDLTSLHLTDQNALAF